MIRFFIIIAIAVGLSASLYATEIDLFGGKKLEFTISEAAGDNQLKFESKAPLEDFIGTVSTEDVKSSVSLNSANVEKTSASVEFPVTSMTTGIDTRDGHMQGDDWLQADKYPNISFDLTALKDINITEETGLRVTLSATATGEMTIKGTTNKIEAPVTLVIMKESKLTKSRTSGHLLLVKGEFKISLKDFKIQGKKDIIGNKVAEKVNIKMNLYYNTGS